MGLNERISGALFDFMDTHRARKELVTLPKKVLKRYAEMKEWVEREARPVIEKMDAAPHTDFDWEIVRKGAQAGFLTRMIPSLAGGEGHVLDLFTGGSLLFLPFVEELASVSPGLAVLFGAHYLGIMPIVLSMDIPLARRLLKPVCAAARTDRPKLCAFAITEPGAGSDVEDAEGSRTARLVTFAEKVPGGYVLNGRKQFISNGSLAWLITVFASLGKGKGIGSWTCFAVTSDMKGFSVGRVEDKMGQRASPTAELVFEDVFVQEKNRVGRENDGWRLNALTLDMSRGPVGAMALGAARTSLRETIAHARDTGLLSDRSVQMELGDMLGSYEAARALIFKACGTFPPLGHLSAMAKFVCTDTAMNICSRCIDLLGEEGTLRRRQVERLYRDIKLTQIFEGTNQVNRLAAAEVLLTQNFPSPI